MKIGKYESVHGWNTEYRYHLSVDSPTRYQSFLWERNRPQNFHNMIVEGNYACQPFLDHQGHIVPQNQLHLILDPIAAAVFGQIKRPETIEELNTFLTTNYPKLKFNLVTDYINDILIAKGGADPNIFINKDENDIDSRS